MQSEQGSHIPLNKYALLSCLQRSTQTPYDCHRSPHSPMRWHNAAWIEDRASLVERIGLLAPYPAQGGLWGGHPLMAPLSTDPVHGILDSTLPSWITPTSCISSCTPKKAVILLAQYTQDKTLLPAQQQAPPSHIEPPGSNRADGSASVSVQVCQYGATQHR